MLSTDMSNGTFYSFVLSVDGMLGKEALIILKNLSRLMGKKERNPFQTYMAGLTDRLQSLS